LSHSIKIDNITDSPLVIVPQRRNFLAYGEDGQPELTDKPTPYSLASWISVEPSEASIPPKGAAHFKFTIAVPHDAEPGGHFGSITFKTKPESTGGGQVAVVQEVGSLVLLKVAGNINEKIEIESFKAGSGGILERGPVPLELRLRNTGNVHVKPVSMLIVIKNMFGQEVTQLKIDPKNVLPDSVRRFEARWNRKWLTGVYSADVTIVYGGDNQVLTRQINFFGFPYRLAGAIAAFVLVFGGWMYRSRKRLRRSIRVLFGNEN
jgi:hypothetical protein